MHLNQRVNPVINRQTRGVESGEEGFITEAALLLPVLGVCLSDAACVCVCDCFSKAGS